jgi:rhamnosyltransferase
MLIPLTVIEEVGTMDASLFIDVVDTEWSFRAMARGYKLFGVCDARMHHSIGDRVARPRFLRSAGIVVHSSRRLYYMFRNHLLLYRRRYVPLRWKLQDALRLAYKAAVFTTSIPPRFSHFSTIMQALFDGIRGKTGPRPGSETVSEVSRDM